jgi:glycosyltransferase involved in cell wall biosynthesis
VRLVQVDAARDWRGGQSQVLLTARGLLARGHEVTLACQADGTLEARARAAGVPVAPMHFRGDLSPAAVLPLARLVRATRAQVLQLNDPHAVGCGLLAARLAGGARTFASRRVDFHLRGPLSLLKYRSCDRVVGVSRAILDMLRQDGLPEQKLRLVYEGVPERQPQPGAEQALRALGLPPGAPLVGNVAALTDHKDHATFLEAAGLVLRRLPEARFLIAGDGVLRAELEARARALGLDGHCVFSGFREDLDRLIPAFTVFCLSSKWEGLGTSLLDAMCFARPVVATAAGGIPEAVEDGVTGRLVPVGRPDSLAEALLQVLTAPDQAAAYGRAGRKRFLAHFGADRMVEETLAVCQELL